MVIAGDRNVESRLHQSLKLSEVHAAVHSQKAVSAHITSKTDTAFWLCRAVRY